MRLRECDEIVNLTKAFVEGMWHGDVREYGSYLHSDAMWNGAEDGQPVLGREEIMNMIMEQNHGRNLVYVDGQTYKIICSDQISCVITGNYRALITDEQQRIAMEKHIITFVWTRTRKNDMENTPFCIKYVHHSWQVEEYSDKKEKIRRAISEISKNEPGIGEFNYFSNPVDIRYFENITDTGEEKGKIAIKGKDKIHRVMSFLEIMYVEIEGKYLRFYLVEPSGNFQTRMNIKTISSILPWQFIKTGRGNVVNSIYIQAYSEKEVVMADGRKIPLSSSGYIEIKRIFKKGMLT